MSDEVGLGKTIIARTVVEKAEELPGVEDDKVYRVVYVCSNQNIIHQNTRNLGLTAEEQVEPGESRLSMLHLVLQEKKQKQKKGRGDGLPRQLIPLTPSTSFSLTSGAGKGAERALIYIILKEMEEFKGQEDRLSELLKTKHLGGESWISLIGKYENRVRKCGEEYRRDIERRLRKNKVFEESRAELIRCVGEEGQDATWELFNKLRVAFAQVSLDQLEPDLVIMDEFQRFSDLLKYESKGEEAMIAREFFGNEHPYVLLLSATPYKPFTTLEELNEEQCDEQYEDFIKLMGFLFKKEGQTGGETFKTVWEDYSGKLSQISGETFDILLASKQKAQDKMYEVMCRTERFSEGLVKEAPLERMFISEDDVTAYCQMQKLLSCAKTELDGRRSRGESLEVNPSYDTPIDYVKSSPYLLSFMQKYQEGKTVRAAFDGKEVPVVGDKEGQRLLLDERLIRSYEKVEPANARLSALEEMLFKSHAERLLWVPASHPYYEIPSDNVFAQNRDFSKVLVFSAWEMVPRMLAVMLSYESERRNVSEAYKTDISDGRLLYFTNGSNAEEVSEEESGDTNNRVGKDRMYKSGGDMLKYRSGYLAGLYDYRDYLGRRIEDIVGELEVKIQKEIDALCLPPQKVTSAEQLLRLVMKLEGEDVELQSVPQRAAITLAYMAIGSPGVCVERILRKAKSHEASDVGSEQSKVDGVIASIVSIFNRQESSAAVELTVPERLKDYKYYEKVLYYCVMGNLQSVLDEYCHMIDEEGSVDNILEVLASSFVVATSNRIETTLSYCRTGRDAVHMRRNFCFEYANGVKDKDIKHKGTLQQAFNSPFRPFVLATTSVGQEGLDFHWYTRKIVHWNLPSNPVDMEQREGRINRYKCLAIRRNIAKFFGDKHTWKEMFGEADEKWRKESEANYSQLVPCWCLPKEFIKGHAAELEYIERIVPMYPMSVDETRYRHLMDVLSLYRLTMGQPRQEELLQMLDGKVSPEQIRELLFDLSPYSREVAQREHKEE